MNANYVDDLYSQLLYEIEKTENEESNVIRKYGKIAILSKSFVSKLRTHVLKEGFNDLEQEIYFLKVTKPKFSSLVYYYEKIYTGLPLYSGQQDRLCCIKVLRIY